MKIPTITQIAHEIKLGRKPLPGLVVDNYHSSRFSGYALEEEDINEIAERIVKLIKIVQFDGLNQETEINSLLDRIAKLEAKLKISEDFINNGYVMPIK